MKKVIGYSVAALLFGTIVYDADGMMRQKRGGEVSDARVIELRNEAARDAQELLVAVHNAALALPGLNAGGLNAVQRMLVVDSLKTHGANLTATTNAAGRRAKVALIVDLQRVAREYVVGAVNNGLLAAIVAVEAINGTNAAGNAALNATYAGMNGWDLGSGALNGRTRDQVLDDIIAVNLAGAHMGVNANERLDTRWHLIRVIAEIAEAGTVGGAAVVDGGAYGYNEKVIQALAKVVSGF